MSHQNRELLEALRASFPQFFTTKVEDGQTLERLDLEQIRLLVGEGNYREKFGLCWENKPERFDADSMGNLPALVRVPEKRVHTALSKPTHVLIEGDNYHALKVLSYTHERSVDVIYIDPPYNTGNKDFKYNDRFVDKEDGYRHSKWLSFMAKRLRLAHSLLKDTGAVFLSIDENEFAQLKLLCDDIFGEANFIAPVIWAAGRKNDSRFVSVSHEYVLCYAKSIAALKSAKVQWTERKEGLNDIYAAAKRCVKDSPDFLAASAALKAWFKSLPDNNPAKAHSHYSWIDARGVYCPDNISWPGGGGPRYDVLHPITGQPCKVPSRGWVFSAEAMRRQLADDMVHFGLDHTKVPCRKSYLKDHETQTPYSVIYKDGRQASKELKALLGANLFGYPKDLSVLKRLISWAAGPNAVILDFFAGSGSTAHAVMQLNVEDGGSRQCILVTNDEGEFKDDTGAVMAGGICTHVTYPRLKKVIEGYIPSNDKAIAGTGENLEFFQTNFQPVPQSRNQLRDFVRVSSEMLCLKARCFTPVESTSTWALFKGDSRYLFVLFDEYEAEAAVTRLRSFEEPVDAYVFAYEQDDDCAETLRQLPHVSVQEVPQPLLDLFHRMND